jgi:hypothetical protein
VHVSHQKSDGADGHGNPSGAQHHACLTGHCAIMLRARQPCQYDSGWHEHVHDRANDCPNTRACYLLVFHEVFFLGSRLPNSLICPNQLQDFGLMVYDTPKRYNPNSKHNVYAPEHRVTIPMVSDGTISYFDTRLPTKDELTTSNLQWDPSASHFAVAEKQATLYRPA